jgi:trimethylamine--corrinoid protein Co-methyltransferase
MMSTAVRNGANFIVHACGQLGAYISMSFEKWLIDEEVCRMIRNSLKAFDITAESIDVDTIRTVGSDGNYLVHPTTLNDYRSLYQSDLFTRADFQNWLDNGARNATEVAAETLPKRLAEYTRPPIDAGLEQALIEFITRRKKEFFESASNSSLKN